MMELCGFKTYRHEQNPKEKELHDKFIEQFADNDRHWYTPVEFLVFSPINGNSSIPSDYLTDREKKIMVSTIQWLGSPVGQNFLRDCGFTLNKDE